MNPSVREQRGSRLLITAAALVITVAGLRAAAPVILPCLVAFLLAAISSPLQRRLQKFGVRPALAIAVTMFLVISLLVGAAFLVTGTANQFAQAAPGYVEELTTKVVIALDTLRERGAYTRLESAGIPVSEWLSPSQVQGAQLVDFVGGLVGGTVRGVANVLSQVLLVLIMLLFLLFETAGFGVKLRKAFPGDSAVRQFAKITREMQRYLAIKTLVGALTGIIIGCWVAILGVDFPVLWGVVAFVLNYIPVFGSILAAIPAVLLTIVQHGLGYSMIVAAGYILVNLLVGNILEPHLMGRRFGLSAFVVCLSLMFWGWLWGPFGMLLSVPLTMVLKIGLQHNADWRWLAVLMGSTIEAGEVTQAVPIQTPQESESSASDAA